MECTTFTVGYEETLKVEFFLHTILFKEFKIHCLDQDVISLNDDRQKYYYNYDDEYRDDYVELFFTKDYLPSKIAEFLKIDKVENCTHILPIYRVYFRDIFSKYIQNQDYRSLVEYTELLDFLTKKIFIRGY